VFNCALFYAGFRNTELYFEGQRKLQVLRSTFLA